MGALIQIALLGQAGKNISLLTKLEKVYTARTAFFFKQLASRESLPNIDLNKID
jgi:hypothetical protein